MLIVTGVLSAATARLLELIDGKTAGWTHRRMEVSLRFRASCGCS